MKKNEYNNLIKNTEFNKKKYVPKKLRVKFALRLDEHAKKCNKESNKEDYIKSQFRLFTETVSWYDARRACLNIGMYLPIITSAEEEQVRLIIYFFFFFSMRFV